MVGPAFLFFFIFSHTHTLLNRDSLDVLAADRYEEEHIPLLRKVPGWESTIRGKAVFFAGEADKTLPPYVGFHRYAKENGNGTSQEWKASMSSEWATKMLGVIKSEGSMARSQWNFEETH